MGLPPVNDSATQMNSIQMKSVKDGVYTMGQAEQGYRIYRKACLKCHHPRQFAGPAYMDSWAGARIHDFLEVIRKTMPTESPGSLKREDYVAIVAFLLSVNSVPAGDTEMSSDPDQLKLVKLEGPFKWSKPKKKSTE